MAKRYGGLMGALCEFSHLVRAFWRARKGSGLTWESAAFEFFLEKELLGLQKLIREGTYQPANYQYFRIYEPKERLISVAPFRDRVVHHAVVAILEPIYERCFFYHSYATRKHKGSHVARTQAQAWVRGYPCFFKADIEKYFESIDHEILLRLLERKIKDRTFMHLVEKIIRNGGENGKGLPIGNLTSQFFANVYLDPLDHFIKQELKIRGYLRYMDDWVCFHHEKKNLLGARSQIEIFLGEKLQLRLKPSASYLGFSSQGLSFLGARIYGGTIGIKRENFIRARRRMHRKRIGVENGEITQQHYLDSMNAYWAYLASFDSLGLRNKLLDEGFWQEEV